MFFFVGFLKKKKKRTQFAGFLCELFLHLLFTLAKRSEAKSQRCELQQINNTHNFEIFPPPHLVLCF